MEILNWLTRQNISLCLMKEAAFQADSEREIQKGNTDFSQISKKEENTFFEEMKNKGQRTVSVGNPDYASHQGKVLMDAVGCFKV